MGFGGRAKTPGRRKSYLLESLVYVSTTLNTGKYSVHIDRGGICHGGERSRGACEEGCSFFQGPGGDCEMTTSDDSPFPTLLSSGKGWIELVETMIGGC